MSETILSLHEKQWSDDESEAMGTMHGTTAASLLDMILEHI